MLFKHILRRALTSNEAAAAGGGLEQPESSRWAEPGCLLGLQPAPAHITIGAPLLSRRSLGRLALGVLGS